MEKELYIYGSENPNDKGKIHICDSKGILFCGTNIIWGEITAIITRVDFSDKSNKPLCEQGFVWSKGFGKTRGNELQSPIHNWEENACKKCNKKLKEIFTIK